MNTKPPPPPPSLHIPVPPPAVPVTGQTAMSKPSETGPNSTSTSVGNQNAPPNSSMHYSKEIEQTLKENLFQCLQKFVESKVAEGLAEKGTSMTWTSERMIEEFMRHYEVYRTVHMNAVTNVSQLQSVGSRAV